MITANDLERIEVIKYLVKKYPNDMELGYNIRRLFLDQDIETKEELDKHGEVSRTIKRAIKRNKE
jgi:hypothetical protein|tara:strand:+ start:277 stop:471 length:195 start_codon:yes stop_codon:yes gene_type:complete